MTNGTLVGTSCCWVVPKEMLTALGKGAKFSVETSLGAHEWLNLNRRLAKKAEDQERCLLDSVGSVFKTVMKPGDQSKRKDPTAGIVRFFKQNDLR